MKKMVQFTDSNGNTFCGTDSVFYIDGRLNNENIRSKVLEYRKRFEKNFPHKFTDWTHYAVTHSGRLECSYSTSRIIKI